MSLLRTRLSREKPTFSGTTHARSISTPAEAGAQFFFSLSWVPAFAGMTSADIIIIRTARE
jgi:hypothetical protein